MGMSIFEKSEGNSENSNNPHLAEMKENWLKNFNKEILATK